MKKQCLMLTGWTLLFTGWVILLTVFPVAATELKSNGFLADDAIAHANASAWNIWGPALVTAGVIGLVIAIIKGFGVAGWVGKVVAVVFIIAGGLPWLAQTIGLKIAFGAERPAVLREPAPVVARPESVPDVLLPWEP